MGPLSRPELAPSPPNHGAPSGSLPFTKRGCRFIVTTAFARSVRGWLSHGNAALTPKSATKVHARARRS